MCGSWRRRRTAVNWMRTWRPLSPPSTARSWEAWWKRPKRARSRQKNSDFAVILLYIYSIYSTSLWRTAYNVNQELEQACVLCLSLYVFTACNVDDFPSHNIKALGWWLMGPGVQYSRDTTCTCCTVISGHHANVTCDTWQHVLRTTWEACRVSVATLIVAMYMTALQYMMIGLY